MNLLDLVVSITVKDEASKGIQGVSTKATTMGTALGTTMGGLVLDGLQKAAGAVVDFGKDTIDAGMNFDSAMSQVAATMGTTTGEISELSKFAKQMGSTTAFSATEAAEGLNYMALAGYSSQEAMDALPTVLNLAAAGSMDLAAASDMVTDAQTALGLEMSDVSTMVDQMAKASSKSNTSVAQLGDAILGVGPNARVMAGGTQELTTVLGLLADNGIKGGEAGTKLRNILQALQAPTSAAAKTMEELGVQASDSEGNLRPLQDIMLDLNDAMSDMTQEEKTQTIAKIFNKQDLAAANALLGTSVERWEELGGEIGDAAGAAEKMAQTQLDNLAGDMTLLQSATEGVQLELAAGVTPSLREMVQAGSEGLSQMASQLQSGDLLGGFVTLGETASQVATKFMEALPEFVDAGMKMIFGFIQGIGQGLPELIPAINTAIVGMVQAIIANVPVIIQAAVSLVQGLIQGFLQSIPALVAMIPGLITTIIDALIQSLPILIEGAVSLVMGVVEALPTIIDALVQAIPQIITAIVTGLIEWNIALVEGFIQLFSAVVENLPLIISTLIELVPMIIESLANGFIEAAPQIVAAFQELFSKLPDKAQEFFTNVIEKAAQWIQDMATKAGEAGKQFLDNVVKFIQELPGKIAEFCSNIIQKVGEWVSNMAQNAQKAGSEFLQNVVEFISQLPGKIVEFCSNIISSIAQWVSDMISKAVEAGSQFLSSVSEGFGNVVSFFMELPGRIIGALGDVGSMLFNAGMQIIQGLINGITNMVGNAISAVTGALGSIVDSALSFLGIHSPSRVFAKIGDYSMQGLAEGFEDGSKEAAEALDDVLGDLTDNSVAIGVKGSAGGGAVGASRQFVFDVTINSNQEALDYGRKIGESLYETMQRMELSYA